MQVRSWTAAWMLLTAVGAMVSPAADGGGSPPAIKQKVRLDIRLDGTSAASGVEIVIKPGHPATKFKEVVYKVKQDGDIRDIPPIEVETLSADRDCSFAITLKDPGHADKVFRRSVQLNPPTEAIPGKPEVMPTLKCYLSSRDVAAKVAPPTARVVTRPATTPVRK